ncbi:outer membrane protein assembly factor BamB [Solimonas aquatica]|nr:outer membrane protein assembly factor BamB [Solimonas aquatica]
MSPRLMRTATLLAVVALALGACSKKNVRKPAALKDIDHPEIQLQDVWSSSAGSGGGGYYGELRLALAPDALFTADGKGRIYAFDPKTGSRIWRADTREELVAGPGVAGDAVFAGSRKGDVVAVKRADGGKLWQAHLSSEVLAAPEGDGSRVFARGGDGKVYALSADTGAPLWSVDRSVPNLTLRGLSPPSVDGNELYVGLDNGRAMALRSSDGQVLWEQTVSAPVGRNELERLTDIDAPLLQEGGDVFVASFGGDLVCLDKDTGQVLWRRSVRSYTGLTLAGSTLVVTDDNGTVWGLDSSTGSALWHNEDLKYRQLSAPAVFEGKVVVGDYKGYLHWLDAKDGHLIARNRVDHDPIRRAPVAGDGLLYVLSTDGDITAVKIRK